MSYYLKESKQDTHPRHKLTQDRNSKERKKDTHTELMGSYDTFTVNWNKL